MKKYLFYISKLYSFAILRPLQNAIVRRGDEVAWFLFNQEKLLPYIMPHEKCLKTIKEVIDYNPCAVFVPGNVVPDFFPGIKVEIFHGFNARKRSEKNGHFRIRNFFDLYCTQGPDTTQRFEELAKKHGFFEVQETGWPKMDPLFDKGLDIHSKKDRQVILLTSTFTPRLSGATALFEYVKNISETGRWKWLVNFHPKMANEVVEKYKSIQNENLVFVETDDIIPLLKLADVMVSDTSSVLSEFLLQLKPVVTFRNQSPGPHLLNFTEPHKLEEIIAHALTYPENLMEEIQKYADHIHPYRDGRSSFRVLEATDDFIARGRDHLKPKPLNLFRRLKMRWKLGYFRF